MAGHWLFKSEPSVFSIQDLERAKRTAWEGVRNYQARNYLREAKAGDGVLFYHSSTRPMAVAGTARIVKEAYPDPTQFDPKSEYYDADAKPDDPRWFLVDIEFAEAFPRPVTLDELKKMPVLRNMVLLRRGRLSVQPVAPAEWEAIVKRGRGK
jgi:predicted RNA-binding protein with PUA-like domain